MTSSVTDFFLSSGIAIGRAIADVRRVAIAVVKRILGEFRGGLVG
jgi:hypothetical protein